jgi:O-antigen/teichoic acid export membrane protein
VAALIFSRGRPEGRHRRVRRHRQWLSKGFWAVTDQGLFALTNFTVSVLLARWLSQSSYGAFSVAFSVLLLMGTVHTALLTEPMLVLGPSRYPERTAPYLRRLTTLHFALTSAAGLFLLIAVGVVTFLEPQFMAGSTLASLAVAGPAILFLWLARRACYIESNPGLAVQGSALYALLVPAGMYLLTVTHMLSAPSSMLSLGICSLLVASFLMVRLIRRPGLIASGPVRSVTRAHWSYGRWALAIGLLSWVPPNAVVLTLPLWHSLDDVATLRVATTLMLPVQHVHTALGPLLLPALVRASFARRLQATARLAWVIFVGMSLIYAPIILIFGSQLAELLFGPQYKLDGATLLLLALIPLATAVSTVSGAVLRAQERLDPVLWSYVAATAVTVFMGLPLVFAYGFNGALASMLLSTATTAIVGTRASRRLISTSRQRSRTLRDEPGQQEGSPAERTHAFDPAPS